MFRFSIFCEIILFKGLKMTNSTEMREMIAKNQNKQIKSCKSIAIPKRRKKKRKKIVLKKT